MQLRSELRRIPIRRSLVRNHLILGGERSLVLLSALSSCLVGFTIAMGKSFIAGILIGFALWSLAIFFLQNMAKSDPMMSRIFKKSINYNSFYPAFGRYPNN